MRISRDEQGTPLEENHAEYKHTWRPFTTLSLVDGHLAGAKDSVKVGLDQLGASLRALAAEHGMDSMVQKLQPAASSTSGI